VEPQPQSALEAERIGHVTSMKRAACAGDDGQFVIAYIDSADARNVARGAAA
jgi:hypothetical protein